MSEVTKIRNNYIDIMKGLLITLVVIGHLQYFEYDSRTLVLIYSFHMHAFLIIGGILSHIHENSKISTVLLKRIKGTLIPYFLFYLISFIIVPTFSNEQRIKALKVVIYGIGIPPDDALNLPLWFLTFYFVVMTVFEIVQILAYRITKLFAKAKASNVGASSASPHNNETLYSSHRSKNLQNPHRRELCERHFKFEMREALLTQLITFLFISIIMFISFRYARIYKLKRLPYNAEIAGFCLGFVFIGNILGKTIPSLFNKIKSFAKKNTLQKVYTILSLSYFFIVILFIWYTLSMKNGRIDLNARDYKNAFYMYIDAILGFFLFASISYFISLIPFIKNLFSYLGKNSLYILAYHVPSVFYTGAYIIPLFPQALRKILSHNSLISIVIMSTLGIGFSLVLSLFHKAIHTLIYNVNSN